MRNKIFGALILLWALAGCGGTASPHCNPCRTAPFKPQGEALFSINFDDGFQSAYDNGLPILDAAGFKTTQFIITGRFETPGYISSSDVLVMESHGHEIAAHTRTHPYLAGMSQAAQQNEILGSYQDLTGLLGHPPANFAYPYGSRDDTSISLVKSTGFSSARVIGVNFHPDDETAFCGLNNPASDRLNLAACAIDANTQFSDVQNWIDTALAAQANGQQVWLIMVIHRVDETGNTISITHQMVQQVVDYLSQKGIVPITQSEGLKALNLN